MNKVPGVTYDVVAYGKARTGWWCSSTQSVGLSILWGGDRCGHVKHGSCEHACARLAACPPCNTASVLPGNCLTAHSARSADISTTTTRRIFMSTARGRPARTQNSVTVPRYDVRNCMSYRLSSALWHQIERDCDHWYWRHWHMSVSVLLDTDFVGF